MIELSSLVRHPCAGRDPSKSTLADRGGVRSFDAANTLASRARRPAWVPTCAGMTDAGLVLPEQAQVFFERARLFRRIDTTAFDKQGFDAEKKHDVMNAKPRIRCPHCKWQPEKTSRWFCAPMGAPEFFKGGCGTRWNTFDTGGKCPGCNHQWTYTSCLACEKTALHEEWYEKKDGSAD